MSEIIELPTMEEIEEDQYSTAQVAAMHDEILSIKGKAIVIKMSRDALRTELLELRTLAKAHDLNDYKTYIKWRGIEAGWDRELTPTELGDIIAAAALKGD